jgi:hypothetical protein
MPALSSTTLPELALTLTQPWASLVAAGEKRIETRSWRTAHRGPLGIHAAKDFPRPARKLCSESPFIAALDRAGYRDVHELPRGALLCVVELLACVPAANAEELSLGMAPTAVESLSEQERAFGDYSPGRWAWVLGEVTPLAEPVPMEGALKLWRVHAWDAHGSPTRMRRCSMGSRPWKSGVLLRLLAAQRANGRGEFVLTVSRGCDCFRGHIEVGHDEKRRPVIYVGDDMVLLDRTTRIEGVPAAEWRPEDQRSTSGVGWPD